MKETDELYKPCIYMEYPNTCSLCPNDGGDPIWYGSEYGVCMISECNGEPKTACKLYEEDLSYE